MAPRPFLQLLRGALVAAAAASVGYQVTAMLAARRWRRHSPAAEADVSLSPTTRPEPARWGTRPLTVSILKPVRGLEPHMESSFASFCVQDYPEYELLFGVAELDDPAVPLIHALAKRYPRASIRLIHSAADLGPNRKVCNMHGLAAAARYDLLLISDSDMRVAPDYLRRVVAPFWDPQVGLVTCPYRGAGAEGVTAALEALGIGASFMPGVFVAALGGAAFAFGSTIALSRDTLQRIGGFEALVDYLADDYQIGKRVADLGLKVHLSSVVVDSILGRRSFSESWARRLRWARTVRACRPLGHLGSALTHTTALALLALICDLLCRESEKEAKRRSSLCRKSAKEAKARKGQGVECATTPAAPLRPAGFRAFAPFALSRQKNFALSPPSRFRDKTTGSPVGLSLALALGVRALAARQIVGELESEAARRWFLLLPVSDLVEAALWLTSLFGDTVLWRGQRYRLLEGGRIERVPDNREPASSPIK